MFQVNEKIVITHSVIIELKRPEGSDQERRFLEKAMALRSISGVSNFECVREVNPNNGHTLGSLRNLKTRPAAIFTLDIRTTAVLLKIFGYDK